MAENLFVYGQISIVYITSKNPNHGYLKLSVLNLGVLSYFLNVF